MIPQGWNSLLHFVNKLLVNFYQSDKNDELSMLPVSKYLCQMFLICHLGVLFLSGSHVGIFMNLPYFIWSKNDLFIFRNSSFLVSKFKLSLKNPNTSEPHIHQNLYPRLNLMLRVLKKIGKMDVCSNLTLINITNFRFLINTDICNVTNIALVTLVHTAMDHESTRNVIRS